jgi:hypothetical protein
MSSFQPMLPNPRFSDECNHATFGECSNWRELRPFRNYAGYEGDEA